MKIGIAGSKGFIGSSFKHYLKSKDISYSVLDDDLRVLDNFNYGQNVDTLVLLASLKPKIGINTGVHEYLSDNYLIVLNALEYCRRVGAKLLYVSTFLYDLKSSLPIDELSPIVANSPYQFSKLLGEDLCQYYSKKEGVNTIILRPSNVYGGKIDTGNFVDTLLNSEHINHDIFRPEDRRDFIHVTDLCAAILKGCEKVKDYTFEVFNIGSGESNSKYEIIDALGIRNKCNVHDSQEEFTDTQYCVSKAFNVLDWSPKVNLVTFLSLQT